MIDVHIIAVHPSDNPVTEWDVRTVQHQEFIGVIERMPGLVPDLDSFTFTDTFGIMKEFDTFNEAGSFAEESVNPVLVC